MNPPVLVVGAGPVGRTAANSLARFRVPVRIIDSSDRPSKLSKALVIWRRSLHTLDGLIPYEQWLQHGRPVGGVGLADSGAIFAAMDLRQPAYATAAPGPCQHMMPAGVLHTQAQIEAELEQHLQDSYNCNNRKYGITVERSTKLDSFTVDDCCPWHAQRRQSGVHICPPPDRVLVGCTLCCPCVTQARRQRWKR
jgi:2-polyprenyl-6-methoxyphenol hydroxylase-like FAD-dependent oxidoreductase